MKYDLTLIPFEEGKPVIVNGRDCTTAARRHNVEINGQNYYIRQNHEGDVKYISDFLESPLTEVAAKSLTGLENIEFALSSLPREKRGTIRIIIEKSEEDE